MTRRFIALFLLAIAGLAAPALAHEVRPGYLELKQTGDETYDVLWKVPAAGDDRRLGIYVRFPEETVDTGEHRGRFVGSAFVERWSVRHPGGLTGQTIHVDGLLLHGFGFAGALHEVGLPDQAIPLALFLFNVGVEAGQLLFVGAALVVLAIARRPLTKAPRLAAWAPAYAIGAVAMFWTLQRVASLGQLG